MQIAFFRKEPVNEKDSLFFCRICLEEDEADNLSVPCACKGSIKHAHNACIEKMILYSGKSQCQTCQQCIQTPTIWLPIPQQHQYGQVDGNDSRMHFMLDFVFFLLSIAPLSAIFSETTRKTEYLLMLVIFVLSFSMFCTSFYINLIKK